MEIQKTEEIKEIVTFQTEIHKVSFDKEKLADWYGYFQEPSAELYNKFIVLLQKKIKSTTDEIMDGERYENSFDGLLKYILTEEFNVKSIRLQETITKYEEDEVEEEFIKKIDEVDKIEEEIVDKIVDKEDKAEEEVDAE